MVGTSNQLVPEMASDPMASQDVPLISSVAVAAEKRLKSGNLSPREVRGSSRIHQMLRLVDSQWLVGFKHFWFSISYMVKTC